MTARTHDLAAITALGMFVLLQPAQDMSLSTALIAILANQIGGITPDIDQPTAPFWRNLPVGKLFGKVFDRLLGGHRFLTHSIIGLVLFGFLSYTLLHLLSPIMPHVNIYFIWLAFMIGMASHLLMDTFTKEGVPWLLPLPFKFGLPPIKKFRITTGKWAEKVLFLALLAFDIGFVATHYGQLLALIHRHIT
jgi:inner membrane protein